MCVLQGVCSRCFRVSWQGSQCERFRSIGGGVKGGGLNEKGIANTGASKGEGRGLMRREEGMGSQGTGRVGQDRIYAPYMTIYLVVSLPKIPCIYRICMVLANPRYGTCTYSEDAGGVRAMSVHTCTLSKNAGGVRAMSAHTCTR